MPKISKRTIQSILELECNFKYNLSKVITKLNAELKFNIKSFIKNKPV